jgi:uncharacterized membrane protein YbhN (UPF0104 family)
VGYDPAQPMRIAIPSPRTRKLVGGLAFAVLSVAAAALVGQKLTHSSWPLAHARPLLVAAAAACYFASFVLRARGWRRLFPHAHRPRHAGCLASVGAAAASGAVLPFRLDYAVKVGTLRKLGGIRIGLEPIVLSIVSLGVVDGIAMLPLSISATATSSADLRGPLLVCVAFGLGCCTLLVAGARLGRVPLLRRSRRLLGLAESVAEHSSRRGRRGTAVAGLYLFGCWSTRALGSTVLLAALGHSFSPLTALCVICLSAAAGVVPVTSGGVVANVGATAAILLVLGVGRNVAVNFSLASGLLVLMSALAAAGCGAVATLALRAVAARPPLAQ